MPFSEMEHRLAALLRSTLSNQSFRCAICGKVCGLSHGDPVFLRTRAELDTFISELVEFKDSSGLIAICYLCRENPARVMERFRADPELRGLADLSPPASDGS